MPWPSVKATMSSLRVARSSGKLGIAKAALYASWIVGVSQMGVPSISETAGSPLLRSHALDRLAGSGARNERMFFRCSLLGIGIASTVPYLEAERWRLIAVPLC